MKYVLMVCAVLLLLSGLLLGSGYAQFVLVESQGGMEVLSAKEALVVERDSVFEDEYYIDAEGQISLIEGSGFIPPDFKEVKTKTFRGVVANVDRSNSELVLWSKAGRSTFLLDERSVVNIQVTSNFVSSVFGARIRNVNGLVSANFNGLESYTTVSSDLGLSEFMNKLRVGDVVEYSVSLEDVEKPTLHDVTLVGNWLSYR